MKPFLWADLTWEEIRDARADGVDMVIFPIGSTEQHGPHLPLCVDTLCAEIVAHAVSARTSVPVLPSMPFGCALGHTRFWPGTLSLSPQTLSLVVREILEDVIAYGFTRILILSGHVTNAAPLRVALEELRHAHPQLQIAQKHLYEASARVKAAYESDAQDWHANAGETALLMHLAPHLVHTDRIFDDPDRTANLVFSYSVPQTSEAGHTGAPTKATRVMGEELFEALVADWTYVVKRALIEKPPLNRFNAAQPEATQEKERDETRIDETQRDVQPPICGPPREETPHMSTHAAAQTDEVATDEVATADSASLFRAPTELESTKD